MERFDAIVVGAGLAGSSAAYTLAHGGASVLLLEVGSQPGSKSLSGGRLYLGALRSLMPGFWEKAPVERYVNRERLTLTKPDAALTVELSSARFLKPAPHSATVLRTRFDRWVAEQAEQAGATVLAETRVDDLARRDGRVHGVVVRGDTIEASAVILAEGVNSLLAERAGLRGPQAPEHYAVAAKETAELPQAVLEERFGLQGEAGLAQLFAGDFTSGMVGGGFLYTNRGSLSYGIVIRIRNLMDRRVRITELFEAFKRHPAVSPLLAGSAPVEYGAHVIPESGPEASQTFHAPGVAVVGDAAGFSLNLGLTVRGMDYAVASGCLAAQAVLEGQKSGALERGDLSGYDAALRSSFLWEDLRTFRRASKFLSQTHLYERYPELACTAMEELLSFDGTPKRRAVRTLRAVLRGRVSMFTLLLDALRGSRAL